MKKRKIKLLSSILGVSAICGLFGVSILNSKDIESVSAITSIEEGVNTQGLSEFSYYDENYGQVIRFMNDESLFQFEYFSNTSNGDTYYVLYLQSGYKNISLGSTLHTNQQVNNINRNFNFDNEINRTELYISSISYYYRENELFGGEIFVDSALYCDYFIKYGLYENGDFTWYETTQTLSFRGADFGTFIPLVSSQYNSNSFESIHAFDEPLLINVTEYTSMIYDFNNGYEIGYSEGYTEGSSQAYGEAMDTGYNIGYDYGYSVGVDSQQSLIQNAYNEGYAQGYANGSDSDSTVASIFSGILQVGMLPVNFFLSIFNFEILGINLSAFVSALLTIAVTIVVVRIVIGSKNG